MKRKKDSMFAPMHNPGMPKLPTISEIQEALIDHQIWLRRVRSATRWLYRRGTYYFFWQLTLTGAVLYLLGRGPWDVMLGLLK